MHCLTQEACGFHQQTSQQPVLDLSRQGQSSPQNAQIVGQQTQCQPHLIRPILAGVINFAESIATLQFGIEFKDW